MVDVIQQSGRHEFGVHGWIHELNTELDADTERDRVGEPPTILKTSGGGDPLGTGHRPGTLARNLRFIKGLGIFV
ncbi:MAG: hypothetical protein Ct9H300mP25_12720 [Acidobacteriota bacterium]|nr:MAG: hypothetical protein Ct9H300mP25_12720 [Acidobacteriota bacterium]